MTQLGDILKSPLLYEQMLSPFATSTQYPPVPVRFSRCLIDSSLINSGVELPLSASTKSLEFILELFSIVALLQLLHVRCFTGFGAELLTKKFLLFGFFTFVTCLLKLCTTTSCEKSSITTRLFLFNRTVSPVPYFLLDGPLLSLLYVHPEILAAFRAGAS